jgi:hypothetical protein
MNISNRLACLVAALTVLSFGTVAEAAPHKHHRHFANKPAYPSFRRTAGGTLIDSQGWRKRDNVIGWDNSCLNLDYLPSMFACSKR